MSKTQTATDHRVFEINIALPFSWRRLLGHEYETSYHDARLNTIFNVFIFIINLCY